MRKILLLLVILTSCAWRNADVWRVQRGEELPPWVVREWQKAQDELLRLPDLKEDPRRFGPEEWEWVQLQGQFWSNDKDGKRIKLRGLTIPDSMNIIICCGDAETVRHEAFHAILWRMHDARYVEHYPELKKELR